MFTTDPAAVNPFTSKAMEAVAKALEQDKPCPSLREWEGTTLLFPGHLDLWKNAPATFSTGKLSGDCAAVQFNEELPKMTTYLCNTSY